MSSASHAEQYTALISQPGDGGRLIRKQLANVACIHENSLHKIIINRDY
jgi:hypothetical protein